MTRPVSSAGSNSHTVAALNGCTNIPRAAMAQENETILELGI
jgi:hypothetical protein